MTTDGSASGHPVVGFPDRRWGSERARLRKPLLVFSSSRAGSWLIRTLTPVDRWLLQRSSGKYTVLGPFAVPLLLLTTKGARSGQPRTTPLVYARDGDALIVAGSNFGQERHPAWSTNLLADPHCTVTIGGTAIAAMAEPLAGPAAQAGYERLVELAETYAVYRSRTDREIRVFRLRRP